MKKGLLILLLLLFATALYAQTDSLRLVHTVRGTVTDARTGRALESVHVSIPDRYYATVTNADGGFTLKSDIPIEVVRFSYIGYKTQTLPAGNSPLKVALVPDIITLNEATIVSGDPYDIVREAVYRIPDNYPDHPELLRCFYRETVRKRQRFTYISEAVARLYKTPYTEIAQHDRAALDKSRVLLSQRKTDTLSVKMMGGPTQALLLDFVKNKQLLLDDKERSLYQFELDPPAVIEGRPQFAIRVIPNEIKEYALYNGTLYIDQETLCFTRIELSLDISDPLKVTRQVLVRRPPRLRFAPKEVSVVLSYRNHDGVNRLEYFRSTLRFNCDWKRKLFSTSYTVVNELVVTDLLEPAVRIPRDEMFRTNDILTDKAAEFLDPDFWKDYNIIEPTESLEHAIDRLKKQY